VSAKALFFILVFQPLSNLETKFCQKIDLLHYTTFSGDKKLIFPDCLKLIGKFILSL